jgi:hypothetical protein
VLIARHLFVNRDDGPTQVPTGRQVVGPILFGVEAPTVDVSRGLKKDVP